MKQYAEAIKVFGLPNEKEWVFVFCRFGSNWSRTFREDFFLFCIWSIRNLNNIWGPCFTTDWDKILVEDVAKIITTKIVSNWSRSFRENLLYFMAIWKLICHYRIHSLTNRNKIKKIFVDYLLYLIPKKSGSNCPRGWQWQKNKQRYARHYIHKKK
jgi:hypothetical protein